MSSPIETETERQGREFRELCFHMGLTLAIWQRLEDEHFRLFVKILGAPQQEICSIVYHSTESFESRRVMVDRVARVFFKTLAKPKARRRANGEWNEIHQLLKDASEDRNKIAHYSVEYTPIRKIDRDGGTTLELGSPRLQPSPHNVVSKLLGRTPDKPEHTLSPKELMAFSKRFNALSERIVKLNRDLPLPQPRLGEHLLQSFGLHVGPIDESLTQSLPRPKADPPFDR